MRKSAERTPGNDEMMMIFSLFGFFNNVDSQFLELFAMENSLECNTAATDSGDVDSGSQARQVKPPPHPLD